MTPPTTSIPFHTKDRTITLSHYQGGLELDLLDVVPDAKIKYLWPISKSKFYCIFLAIFLLSIDLIKYYKSSTIILCGGIEKIFVACVASFITFKRIKVYFPGVRDKNYSLLNLLTTITTASVNFFTCDLMTAKNIPRVYFYSNWSSILLRPPRIIPLNNRKYDFVCVGRIDENKRVNELLTSLDDYLSRTNINHTINILIISKDPLSYTSKHFQLTHVSCNSNEITDLLSQCKLLLLYSVYESSPRVVAESVAAGTVFLAKYVGNLKLCVDNCNGITKSDTDFIKQSFEIIYFTDDNYNNMLSQQFKALVNLSHDYHIN